MKTFYLIKLNNLFYVGKADAKAVTRDKVNRAFIVEHGYTSKSALLKNWYLNNREDAEIVTYELDE